MFIVKSERWKIWPLNFEKRHGFHLGSQTAHPDVQENAMESLI